MTDIATPKEVIAYRVDGKEPFTIWLVSLRDREGRRRILMRTNKLKQGIYGDHRLLAEGVRELRIFSGPGYRVYLGEYENEIVILLGGDKDSQQSDIQQAKDYWREYKKRKKLP